MELNEKNYYSLEADKEFMSVHQYLGFAGHMGIRNCEARAMAKLSGEYTEPTTEAQLVGSFVDAHFEGTLNKFKKEHPECFTQKGELRAEFKKAQKMIKRCEQDEFFMQFMSGEKQRIFTGNLFGCEWKCKLDSYIPHKCIVDLKTTANMHQSWRVADYGTVCFVEYWGYVIQLAVYQKIVEIDTGEKLPCFIAAVTKEDEPEIAIIGIDQQSLDHALNEVEMNMPSVLAVKNGETEPIRCERCNYCKSTAKLTRVIHYNDLVFGE
jgi:hypothetical protein